MMNCMVTGGCSERERDGAPCDRGTEMPVISRINSIFSILRHFQDWSISMMSSMRSFSSEPRSDHASHLWVTKSHEHQELVISFVNFATKK